MIPVSGSGNVGATALYTSALATGAYLPAVRVTAASVGATAVKLALNGVTLQVVQLGSTDLLVPVVLASGDVLTYEINASSGGSWAFDFYLYPSGDVAL